MVPEPLRQPRPQLDPPRVPGYAIEGVIGRGATGIVYRARQLAVDREVALKVLHPELSGRQRIVRRLQREARTTARLAHPNIVTAIDMGEVDGRWWYAMELVEGPSLSLRLRQEGRLKEREALRFFIPLCEALEHLWEHGVVHRDIKPGNILIDRGGRARLADLGLAFADDDPELTALGGTLGTPHYISPEQAVDPSSADVRSDIWSFGATLYHAVCGFTPFAGDSAAEILSGVLYGRIPDPLELEPFLSKGLALVLRKCLTRDPAGRYQTPRELLLDLERVRERRQPHVRRRALDPVRRRGRGWQLPALALALLVAAALGAWWWTRDPAQEGEEGAQAESTVPQSYEPLEAIARRHAEHPEAIGTHLRELIALQSGLPASEVERGNALLRDLRAELRRRVESIQAQVQSQVFDLLARKDYAGARHALEDELDPQLLRETGLRAEDLEDQGIVLGPWRDRLALEVTTQSATALQDLRSALQRWTEGLGVDVDDLRSQRRWRSARKLIPSDEAGILAAVGFGDRRFPAQQLDQALLDARSELYSLRLHVEDDWRETDRELRQWVDDRARTLARELDSRELVRGADTELDESFQRELKRQRVEREESLTDVASTAFDGLERRKAELARQEQHLQDQDLTAAFEHAESEHDLFCRSRKYDSAAQAWEKAREKLEQDSGGDADWRQGLAEHARLRSAEVHMLEELLFRVSDRIRALDGKTVDLWVGSILRPKATVRSGDDPLHDGFHIEGWPDPLQIRELRSSDVETLAGLDAPAGSLSPEDRLLLGLFRFHEDRFDDALRTLRSGALPEEGEAGRLAADLMDRALGAVQRQVKIESERAERVKDLLQRTLEGGGGEHSPDSDLQRIKVLLEDYGEVDQVREHKEELLALRDRLTHAPARSAEAAFQNAFRPASVEFPRPGRVRLSFTFDGLGAGAWDHGDWRFDGRGWSLTQGLPEWSDVAAERGPRLVLHDPLDLSTGSFDARFTVEQPAGYPPQLLVLSVAGFHIALSGSGLPGGDGQPRWLADVGEPEKLLQRIQDGEGTAASELLPPGEQHVIELHGYRGSGRLEVGVDGRALGPILAVPPRSDDLAVSLFSWEPVRLVSFTLEANR